MAFAIQLPVWVFSVQLHTQIEGLEGCPLLWNLNLNNNFIERIEGLSHLRSLNTLTIQKNKIGFSGVDDLLHLVETTISTLDVQDNKIWDPDILPEDRRAAEAFNRGGHWSGLFLKERSGRSQQQPPDCPFSFVGDDFCDDKCGDNRRIILDTLPSLRAEYSAYIAHITCVTSFRQ
eukprot:Skav219547  [mRNA]  locus=scaffold1863:72717:83723:+ [translate_table: standard]